MSAVLLLTDHGRTPEEVLPALGVLPYAVRMQRARADDLAFGGVIVVDARKDLHTARSLCRELRRARRGPLLAVFTDGGLVTLDSGWGVDDVLLDTAPVAEVVARIRMAGTFRGHARNVVSRPQEPAGLTFDEAARIVRLDGRVVSLTFAEYQILARLAARPGQVLTHRQLLDAYGSAHPDSVRSVYTHVRRLRAKLGDHASLIHTNHGIGYRLDPPQRSAARTHPAGSRPHR